MPTSSEPAAPGAPVIRVEGLSKLYKIGALRGTSLTLRETLADLAAAPLRRLVSLGQSLFASQAGREAAQSFRTRGDDYIWALHDVSFEVAAGEVVGVIGRNGSGKSTLLRILTGITDPTEGRAEIHGRVGSLLEVGTGFHPELTGRENIALNGAILGMTRREIAARFDEIVAFADIHKFIDTPVKRYSSGMYVRLAFAVAAHLEPEILLVDEVLAVGDIDFQRKCMGKIGDVARGGRTILFVSHNMAAVRRLCPRALLLEDGKLVHAGPTDEVIQRYMAHTDAAAGTGLEPGYIYHRPDAPAEHGCAVTGVRLLDERQQPLRALRTWDPVRIRIEVQSDRDIQRASVEIKIQTVDGTPLMLCSTQPDSNVLCPIRAGAQHVDCIFPRWPLAEGTYVLGAGLAVPGLHYLWWRESLGRLDVGPRDVFESGLPPSARRSVLVVEHTWDVPRSQPGS